MGLPLSDESCWVHKLSASMKENYIEVLGIQFVITNAYTKHL